LPLPLCRLIASTWHADALFCSIAAGLDALDERV
jgi:hypothetical protein